MSVVEHRKTKEEGTRGGGDSHPTALSCTLRKAYGTVVKL